VPEDRNEAIKKQLLKKRDDAARRKIPLAPGEMVDDAFARGSAAAGRWIKANSGALQWALLALVALGIAYGVYDRRTTRRAEEASAELMKAVVAEHGRVIGNRTTSSPEDDASDDPTPTFKSVDERREAALAAYRKVTAAYGTSGAGILARLGEAGILLDKRDYDGALAAYRDVRTTPLAAADLSVRGRAVEGSGLSLEGKNDLDGALKAFRELENTDTRGLKELGMYHQARILFGKGELEPAKELLKGARERLKTGAAAPASEPRPFGFLESQVDDLLRRIDPTAITATPARATPEDGRSMTPERLEQLKQQMQRQIEEQQRKKSAGQGSTPAPAGSP
jgi:hypothetical protein